MCSEVGSANRGGECQKPGGAGGEQFKQKCDANKGKCDESDSKSDAKDFRKAAGADGAINQEEFKAAGLEDKLGQSFDKIAGADGKISQEEFDQAKGEGDKFDKAAGADSKMDKKEFKKSGLGDELGKKFQDVAGADGEMSKDEYMSALNDKNDCSSSDSSCGNSDWRRKIAERGDNDGGYARMLNMSNVFNNNVYPTINQQSRSA